jgi:hypothetical protein
MEVITKSLYLGSREGTTALFSLPTDEHMFTVLKNFSMDTPLFLDAPYNGQSLKQDYNISQKLDTFYPAASSIVSTFPLQNPLYRAMPIRPPRPPAGVYENTAPRKTETAASPSAGTYSGQTKPAIGWPENFPDVVHFMDETATDKPWKLLAAYPDYNAAKNKGDREAAFRLVDALMQTQRAYELIADMARNYPNALIVPIRAHEENSKNFIPSAIASYISAHTLLPIQDDIIQNGIVSRSHKDTWYRFAHRPEFTGTVEPGRDYILIDDVFSHGGSFSELRQFIEKQGGNVVLAAAMTTGGHGQKLAISQQTSLDLERKHGIESVNTFLREINVYGGNYQALTEPEAYAVKRAASLDEARTKIIAAGNEAVRETGYRAIQKNNQTTTPGNGTGTLNDRPPDSVTSHPSTVHQNEPAYAGSPPLLTKEPAMALQTLTAFQKDKILVEYLQRLSAFSDEHQDFIRAYHADFTGIDDYAWLKNVPQFGRLGEQYLQALDDFKKQYPQEPVPSDPVISLANKTPLQFLSESLQLASPESYRPLYNEYFQHLSHGEIKELSPSRLALFKNGHALPLLLDTVDPSNMPIRKAAMYRQANNQGIALQGSLPTPDEVEKQGTGILQTAYDHLSDAINPDYALQNSQPERRAQLEYLETLRAAPQDQREAIHREYTAISLFKKFSGFPQFDDLDNQYRKLIFSYRNDYPYDKPPYYTMKKLTPLSHLPVPSTPLQFLQEAAALHSPEAYHQLYNRHYRGDLPTGKVKLVSPDKAALFITPQELPVIITKNDSKHISHLFTLANHNGIVPITDDGNAVIPSPKEINQNTMGLIQERLGVFNKLLSQTPQERDQTQKTAQDNPATASYVPPTQSTAPEPSNDTGNEPTDHAQGGHAQGGQIPEPHEKNISPEELFINFVNNPFSPGVRVPQFGVWQNSSLKLMEQYSFVKAENNGHTVVLSKRGPNGLPETAKISNTLYDHIIRSANAPANSKELSPEVIKKYEQEVSADVDKTRPNTASNFWHNYRVLARREALNPVDAARIATRIYCDMNYEERAKFDKSIALYEKERKESYNTRIARYYEQAVKDIPITNRTPHDGYALKTILHNDDSIDTKGKSIDKSIRLKIGDQVKLNISIPDFTTFAQLKTIKTDLYLASSSENLNKVILMSRDNSSKYILPRDTFIANMQKIEKRMEKQHAAEEKKQYKKALRESVDFGY